MKDNSSIRISGCTKFSIWVSGGMSTPAVCLCRWAATSYDVSFANRLFAKLTSYDVAAHRQRQTAGVLMPPLTQIENFVQPEILIEELSFMNQQTGINSFFRYRINDLIEGH